MSITTKNTWPPTWEEFIQKIQTEWKLERVNLRKSLVGKSRSLVFLVEITMPNYGGLAILKLATERNETDDIESDRHRHAEKLDPIFAEKHLPKPVKSFREANRSAILMTVAGEGLNFTSTFFSLPARQQYLAAQTVSKSLLNFWNRNCTFPKEGSLSTKLLQTWLGDRIGKKSRLPDLLQESFGLSPDIPSFRIHGRDYPNPYIFAKGSYPDPIDIILTPAMGHTHGDFHGLNLLIGDMYGTKKDFYIIDLDSFKSEHPLLFDHAYFEFSFLLNQKKGVGLERWLELVESIIKIENNRDVLNNVEDQRDHGVLWTISLFRLEIWGWISSSHKHRKEDLTNQLFLARVAAGLNYANKKSLDDEDPKHSNKLKEFSFLYAAANLKRFFAFNGVKSPIDGPLAQLDSGSPFPSTMNWREVWNYCDAFDARRNTYILIAGPELRNLSEENKKILGQIPWSMVLDFDNLSDKGGIVASTKPILSSKRGFHFIVPEQSEQINFKEGVCWLMADGWQERPDSLPSSQQNWRQRVPRKIRRLAKDLKETSRLMPVSVLVLGRGVESQKLRQSVLAIEEVLGGLQRTVIIADSESDNSYQSISEEIENCIVISCRYNDLMLGLRQMLGEWQGDNSIQIPFRDQTDEIVKMMPLDPQLAALVVESVEIVHDNLANESSEEINEEVADFLHGNVISWRELDLNVDADRDITFPAINTIRSLLKSSRSVNFALEHTPGAGGTTVSRRIAWSLRNEFPTVILKTCSEVTVSRLDDLFQLTNLPILIIVENSNVPKVTRDRLFKDLKARNVRFVFLDIVRQKKPNETKTSKALKTPMSPQEARRFLARYRERASNDRWKALTKLTNDPKMGEFRSPFFFGLYAFGEKFQYIPDFVNAHLSNLSEKSREIITYLALITRYSQENLPSPSFCLMADLSVDTSVRIGEILGDPAKNLIMYDGVSVRIVHSLVAQEILKIQLQPKEASNKDAWRANLSNLCINFIRLMRSNELYKNEETISILSQLFINRNLWYGDGKMRQLFSELITDIPNPTAQHRVLTELCQSFNSPHFWSHLGRHTNINKLETYEKAAEYFQRSIDLDPNNEIHHHGLGMVYRFAVKDRLALSAQNFNGLLNNKLEEIDPLFSEAETNFQKALELDPEGEYPLVSQIQMTNEAIERLFRLSGKNSYVDFLTPPEPVADWCRRKLELAEKLMEKLKHIQAEAPLSHYTVVCDGKLQEFHGNPTQMIEGLRSLLKREDIIKMPIRRLLAHSYIRRAEQNKKDMDEQELRFVMRLMQKNLFEDPTNGQDIQLWLRMLRSLPEFSLNEALDKLSTWAHNSDAIDANYYLYILHFINLKEGVPNSYNEVKKHLEICRKKAPDLGRRKSFEWWSADNLSRYCPLVHHSELGRWNKTKDFFHQNEKLGFFEGVIDEIKSPQSGTINVLGLPAFFAPKMDFRVGADTNRKVKFYLGFSYEGLRAWSVTPLD